MAQKERNKEFWLIPKRANLHQTVTLLKGIAELDYDNKTWNGSKQDRLGSFLGKNGATKDGRTITPQSIRTLLASIPQYFGFVFINTKTTPNSLSISKAGLELLNEFQDFLENYNYRNLTDAEKSNGDIQFSNTYLKQFAKLQITNPVILKDCENIFVFPLIFVIKIINIINYLTFDELAYFVFKSKGQDEIDLIALEINNFRNLNLNNRKKLIDTFKKTHLGNISLVQAASTSYFEKLIRYTELFEIDKILLPNPGNSKLEKVNAIVLSKSKTKAIEALVKEFEKNIAYDFKGNLSLWMNYIGNPLVKKTPKDFSIFTSSSENILITISQNDEIIFADLINEEKEAIIPIIETYNYSINIINPNNGSVYSKYKFDSKHNSKIDLSKLKGKKIDFGHNDLKTSQNKIKAHVESKMFDPIYSQYLSIVEKISEPPRNLLENKNLRGAYLEYLFYTLLLQFQEAGILDEIIWNGKIGEFGLPSPAPGGQHGISDIIAFKDDKIFVFELTTIKPKAMQWQAEGASVPDHIKIVAEKYKKKKIIGFYLAPEIHERITSGMKSNLSKKECEIRCVKIIDFIAGLSMDKKFAFETYFSK